MIKLVEQSLDAQTQPSTKSADIKKLQESFIVTQPDAEIVTEETYAGTVDLTFVEIAPAGVREQVVAVVELSSDAIAELANGAETIEGVVASLMALPITTTK